MLTPYNVTIIEMQIFEFPVSALGSSTQAEWSRALRLPNLFIRHTFVFIAAWHITWIAIGGNITSKKSLNIVHHCRLSTKDNAYSQISELTCNRVNKIN